MFMSIRQITPDYATSPFITPADVPNLAAAGFKSILCHRPDAESAPGNDMATIEAASVAAGLKWAANPFDAHTFSADVVIHQRDLMATLPGPILAYCASGTRSGMVWAFAQTDTMSVEDILAQTAASGFTFEHLRSALRG